MSTLDLSIRPCQSRHWPQTTYRKTYATNTAPDQLSGIAPKSHHLRQTTIRQYCASNMLFRCCPGYAPTGPEPRTPPPRPHARRRRHRYNNEGMPCRSLNSAQLCLYHLADDVKARPMAPAPAATPEALAETAKQRPARRSASLAHHATPSPGHGHG